MQMIQMIKRRRNSQRDLFFFLNASGGTDSWWILFLAWKKRCLRGGSEKVRGGREAGGGTSATIDRIEKGRKKDERISREEGLHTRNEELLREYGTFGRRSCM